MRRLHPEERGIPSRDTLDGARKRGSTPAILVKTGASAWVEALLRSSAGHQRGAKAGARRADCQARDKGSAKALKLQVPGSWNSASASTPAPRARPTEATDDTDLSDLIAAIAAPASESGSTATRALVTIDVMGTHDRHRGHHRAPRRRLSPAPPQRQPGATARHDGGGSGCLSSSDEPPPGQGRTLSALRVRRDADRTDAAKQRRRAVCHAISWMWSGRRYSDEPRRPHLSADRPGRNQDRTGTERSSRTGDPYFLSGVGQARRRNLAAPTPIKNPDARRANRLQRWPNSMSSLFRDPISTGSRLPMGRRTWPSFATAP